MEFQCSYGCVSVVIFLFVTRTKREGLLKSWSYTLSVIAGACLLFVSALARPNVDASSELMEQGWEHITFNHKQPNRFASCGDGCVEVRTHNSVSMIGKEFVTDPSKMPKLSWEWRIEHRV